MSRTYKKWAPSDIEFILNHKDLLDKEVAEKLSALTGQTISPAMVRRQRRKSGVAKLRGRPKKSSAQLNTQDATA